MLLPALSGARERGREISCSGQMRGIGSSLQLYVMDFEDWYVPYCPQLDKTGRFGEVAKGSWASIFYDFGYLKQTRIYYCPSARPPTEWPDYGINGSYSAIARPKEKYTYKYIDYGYSWKFFGSGGTVQSAGSVLVKASRVKKPSQKITFAESRHNRQTDGFFIVDNRSTAEGNIAPRHGSSNPDAGTVNLTYADGHVDSIRKFCMGDFDSDEMVDRHWAVDK